MSHLSRRHLIAAGLLVWAGALHAQDSAPIKMVVPFGPGTTTDTVGRVVAEALARTLHQTIVVDNRAGAGGSVGTDQVAKAAPDGKTLVMGTVGTHAINAALFRKLPYDTLRDFAPIAFIGYTPTLLVVAANSPAKTLKDLAAMAARPEGVTFASAGNGTSGHLAGIKDFDLVAWFMLYAPAATAPAALSQLRTAAATALVQPDTVARLRDQGIEQRAMRPDEMVPFNQAELVKWADLVKRSGAQVD